MIDLDVNGAGPATARRRVAWAKVLTVVAWVLLGAVVGAAAGQRWEAGRERDRRADMVSLFVTVAGLSSVSGGDGKAVVDGEIAVGNSGPVPIQVAGTDRVNAVIGLGPVAGDRAGLGEPVRGERDDTLRRLTF